MEAPVIEALPHNTVLKYNADTLEYLRKQYGFDKPTRMSEAIDILEEWLKKQEHFVQKTLLRKYLERILIHNKGSVEKSKKKFDRVCTLRTLLPELFEDHDLNDLRISEDALMDIMIPTMTPDHCRVHLFKGKEFKMDPLRLKQYLKLYLIICDYLQLNDYNNGVIYFNDWRNSHPLTMLLSASPAELKKVADIAFEGYSMRIKAIHLLTDSPAITAYVTLFKQVVSPKIGSRIHIHKTLDTIYEHIPKDILPVEYGGNGPPMSELRENLLNELNSKEFQDYRREINSARTNETFRPKDKFYDEYMGMSGTFRNLSVD